MDVLFTCVACVSGKCRLLLCGDGYELPFAADSFDVVLLVAVLEHTREPWRVLAEARRVLQPGGHVVMVVPNDVTMSVGRLLFRKFPNSLSRSPDLHDARSDADARCGDLFLIRAVIPFCRFVRFRLTRNSISLSSPAS